MRFHAHVNAGQPFFKLSLLTHFRGYGLVSPHRKVFLLAGRWLHGPAGPQKPFSGREVTRKGGSAVALHG